VSGRGDGALLLAGCARLYGALLVLYPRAFRRRYGAEMRRDFRQLSREGLEEGGARRLGWVLAVGLSDLAITALAERSSAAARRRGALPFSVDPRMAARAMAAALLATAVAAVFVTLASLMQTPLYEASAKLLVGQMQLSDGKVYSIPSAPMPDRQLAHTVVVAIESRPVAEEVIQKRNLQMGPQDVLDHLSVEQIEDTSFLRLTYTDTDPVRTEQVVNDVSSVATRRISAAAPPADASISGVAVTVWERAVVPDAPVSPKPLRNGLLALVAGLVLCAGLALALPGPSAASVAGGLGGRAALRGVGRAGAPAAAPAAGRGVVEGAKEKELLRALGRRGKLTAVEAALETSLTVEEANRILFDLAARGHLEVTVEHGKLLYSFWEQEAP
jgi:capsular polysaccharide biosynthesis protein